MQTINRDKKVVATKSVSRGILVVNLVGLLILGGIVYWTRESNDQSDSVSLPILPADVSALTLSASSAPATLIIPSIGVNAKVEPMGKTAGGRMAVPRSLENAGWYKLGTAPGGIGNAVIAGHLGTDPAKPGVFTKLNNLKIGDLITVVGESGEKNIYKVTGTKVVPYDDPGQEILEEIFGKTDKARLNLITCDGTWLPAKKTFADRLIISSELVTVAKP